MNKLIIVIFIFLNSQILFCCRSSCSCENSGTFKLNLYRDSVTYRAYNLSNVKLMLEPNGNYHFVPQNPSLLDYEGKWCKYYEGIDGDASVYRFNYKNGEVYKNSHLMLQTNINGQKVILDFDPLKR